MNKIELLAPAKDLASGIVALDSGADAVYIGGPRFGARAAASNSLDDIRELISYAHLYHARVYVTLNTLLRDEELPVARRLIQDIYEAGADALIIQDMGLLEMDLPPIALYASTQCHITTPQKALFLEKAGFRRLILARELSLQEIDAIRGATTVELESFVHGAICVCYSGQCSMSYAAGGRSGNRGECAQPCRMHYDLLDESGAVLARDRYFLSVKDLNLSLALGDMLDAGISSFKIEGRLKDAGYIRNVVSHYRQRLDEEMASRGMNRSSSGRSDPGFIPDPAKSFNRGFTEYFLRGVPDSPESPLSQKSLGESLGRVAKVELNYFWLEQDRPLSAGDGICFFDEEAVLGGMFVEHVEGSRIYPRDIRYIREGMELYRNNDKVFEKELEQSSQARTLEVAITFQQEGEGFVLTATDEDGITVSHREAGPFEAARKEEQARANIEKQLMKTGGTAYRVSSISIDWKSPLFIVISTLNEARRSLLDALSRARSEAHKRREETHPLTTHPYPEQALGYEGNVLNAKAADFYRRHGVSRIEPAAESGLDMAGRRVMTTRHCIKRMLGMCGKYPQESLIHLEQKPRGTLFLDDGRHKYRLEFACERCEMEVYY